MLLLQSKQYQTWLYDQIGTKIKGTTVPVGEPEGSTAYLVTNACADLDGSIWIRANSQSGTPTTSLFNIRPSTGELISRFDDINLGSQITGNHLRILPNGKILTDMATDPLTRYTRLGSIDGVYDLGGSASLGVRGDTTSDGATRNNSFLNVSIDHTRMGWFKVPTELSHGDGEYSLWTLGAPTFAGDYIWLGISYGARFGGVDPGLQLWVEPSNGSGTAGFSLAPGQWYHIAVRYKASSNELTIVVDGNQRGAADIANLGALSLTTDEILGSGPIGDLPNVASREVRVFQAWLTDGEITAEMRNASPIITSSLLSDTPLPSPADLTDHSTGGHDWTVYGSLSITDDQFDAFAITADGGILYYTRSGFIRRYDLDRDRPFPMLFDARTLIDDGTLIGIQALHANADDTVLIGGRHTADSSKPKVWAINNNGPDGRIYIPTAGDITGIAVDEINGLVYVHTDSSGSDWNGTLYIFILSTGILIKTVLTCTGVDKTNNNPGLLDYVVQSGWVITKVNITYRASAGIISSTVEATEGMSYQGNTLDNWRGLLGEVIRVPRSTA